MFETKCVKCGKIRIYQRIGGIRKLKTKLCLECFQTDRTGERAGNWKGGRKKGSEGYMFIFTPNHPYADSAGYVREHRLMIEKSIGRYLIPTEEVHHINHIRDDNRLENLELCNSHSRHVSLHHRKYDAYCKVKNCGKKHASKGYCDWHYRINFIAKYAHLRSPATE